ncbi:MAG: hypothetical protein FOGNACKC_03620 [Anaerolineae bacterium]|nr:hypothetical protein [Anaerolineae bacterium]
MRGYNRTQSEVFYLFIKPSPDKFVSPNSQLTNPHHLNIPKPLLRVTEFRLQGAPCIFESSVSRAPCSASISSGVTTVFKACDRRSFFSPFSKHSGRRHRYTPRPLALPVRSNNTLFSGVRTILTSAFLSCTSRQTMHVRCGLCLGIIRRSQTSHHHGDCVCGGVRPQLHPAVHRKPAGAFYCELSGVPARGHAPRLPLHRLHLRPSPQTL